MSKYVLMNAKDGGAPLAWAGPKVGAVGVMRHGEAVKFETREAAQALINAGVLPAPKLYRWRVARQSELGFPPLWTPRPGDRGYDVMS